MLLTALAKTPMSSGNWCVSRASMAVKEQRPAVKRMKKGSSFLGYTDTSWNTAYTRKHTPHTVVNHIVQPEAAHTDRD